jgi:hypothetical protein
LKPPAVSVSLISAKLRQLGEENLAKLVIATASDISRELGGVVPCINLKTSPQRREGAKIAKETAG